MFNIQVSQDLHNSAMEYLEDHLDAKLFRFDVDDVSAMVEQVASLKIRR